MALAVFAVFLLVSLSASGMRHALPGLKEATRSAALRSDRESKQWRNRFQARGGHHLAAGGATTPRAARVHMAPPRQLPRPSSLPTPVGALAPGADAFGTSLPKRERWKAMGGHGRHGPGAGI